jgi:hypothetical protein
VPDPTNVYTPWNTSLAKQWLMGLKNKPLMVAIDNEIEIASNTHQDMHPQWVFISEHTLFILNGEFRLMGYDEELARVIEFATAAKEALPDVLVVAPSTCSWWYCALLQFFLIFAWRLIDNLDWTSSIGYTDNAAHNNVDFLPWFLAQMKAHDQSTGKRLLDYLDLHYYFQPDTSANDAAAKALRLRMTRSLWVRIFVLAWNCSHTHTQISLWF